MTFASGRRAKWWILAVTLVAFGFAGSLAGKFQDAQQNEPADYLPGSAESVEALRQAGEFPSGSLTTAVVVYRRDGGLRSGDRAAIAANRARFNAARPAGAQPLSPPTFSPDGTTAVQVTGIRDPGKGDVLENAVDRIRAVTHRTPPGLVAKTSGPAGFSTDAIKVFGQINGTLLLATVGLVFFLLIVIYRSPIFWVIPLFSVAVAETISRAIGYGLAEAGVTITGQSGGILSVLVFGAGTDYALLLVSRFREELRRRDDKHEAMRIALGRAGPAILASGSTVVAALLCLALADVNATSGLGPIGAIGIALAMLTSLTILPALLLIGGRRMFWPFVPHVGDDSADETHGFWRRVGERVQARPRRVAAGTVALLVVCCLGLTQFDTGLTSSGQFRNDVEAVAGQKLLARAFPAGANAPTTVVVPRPEAARAVADALERRPEIARVQETDRGRPGVKLAVTLKADPYSQAAFDSIPGIRRTARQAGGDGVLVGGPTAEERDLRDASARDNRVIIPLVLLVIFAILALLLRALVAPMMLIATVILSFAAAMGVGAFMSTRVFGFQGLDPSFPLLAFVFLVALGVDYNIFLMARVREEAQRLGTREGMLRGLAVTGAVITSAGIVLAGTFSTLAVLPLVPLTEIGFTIAVGVLLDALIVRSLLVPALTFMVGSRIWAPSALARRRGPAAPSRS